MGCHRNYDHFLKGGLIAVTDVGQRAQGYFERPTAGMMTNQANSISQSNLLDLSPLSTTNTNQVMNKTDNDDGTTSSQSFPNANNDNQSIDITKSTTIANCNSTKPIVSLFHCK